MAFLDNVGQDARFTLRALRRTPLAAATIVLTVGLGLGLVAAVFTILNAFIFRVDAVRDPHGLFAVGRQGASGALPEGFTRTQYDSLVLETDVFSAAFASTADTEAWIDGSRREGRLVTGNFFDVLGAAAARGRTLNASDDDPGRPPVLVLSHRAWTQHFAGDPGILGRTIRVNDASFQIVGVMPEDFRGLEVITAPDFWAPLSLLPQFRDGYRQGDEAAGLQIVGRLSPGVSREQALARLLVWDARQAADRSAERPVPALVLEPRQGTVPLSADILVLFMPLFFAFGLILMIGCANVANLLLARAVARQREIGIRLAIGASRRRVVAQLLTESLLLALASAALAFFVSRLVLAGSVYALTSTWPPDIGNLRLAVPPADWRVVLFLVAGAVAATVVFALAPALQATRIEVLRAIRGEVVRDGRPGRARDALVMLQVTGSALLLVCAAIFLRSSWTAATVDPGVRTADIVNVDVVNEQRRATVLEIVTSEPSVVTVAATWPRWPEGLVGVPALAEGSTGRSAVSYRFVSPEYFEALDVDLVRGRGFTDEERSASAAAAIVSERVAEQLWPGLEPLGQVLRIEAEPTGQPANPAAPPPLAQSLVVVGVVRDVTLRLFGARVEGAGIYVPVGIETPRTSLTMRVRGDAERVRQVLAERLAAVDPNLGEVSTLRTIARAEAYLLSVPFWLTLALGTLALLLTLSGLFSVVSYLVERRATEIGVRMALGATSRSIAALVLSGSARPVAIGLALGASLTAALGAVLLATPAAEMIGGSVRLFDPLAYAVSLLCIVAACTAAALVPALRAGRIDPVRALRQE